MDADSSSSATDSDDEPSPMKNSTSKKQMTKNDWKIFENQPSGANSGMDENTMVYHLYPLPSPGATESSNYDGLINSTNLATLQAFAYNLSKDYIWHNEPFRLFCKGGSKPYFYGRTNFGDNMEDEWFIVFLLFEISKNFPDYIISVTDSDGQFLLIEAADYVPVWLNDEIADHRVFIFRGALHIVPLSKHLKPCPRALSHSSLEHLLVDEPGRVFAILQEEFLLGQAVASDKIQRTIMKRIEGYPERISTQRHRVNCILPAKLVAVLYETESFFLPAVVHLACQDTKKVQQKSSIDFSSTDLLTTSVVLSKHLFAKLSAAKGIPNFDTCNWNLPKKDELGFKANELGMKLTKGFEILCDKASLRPKPIENGHTTSDLWEKFVEVLQILGYFEGVQEGSKEYERLMKRTKLCYEVQSSGADGKAYEVLMGARLTTILDNLGDTDIEFLRRECPPQEEDSEEWLTMTPERLDTLLSNMSAGVGATKASNSNSPKKKASSSATNGSPMANGGHSSQPSVISKNAVKVQNHVKPMEGAQPSSIPPGKGADSDIFSDSVKRMLDLHIPQDGDDSSDMESYGDEVLDLSLDEKEVKAINALAEDMKKYMKFVGEESKSDISGPSTKPKHAKNHVKTKKAPKIAKPSDKSANSPGNDSIDFEDDDFTPVDIDKKLVSNMLESYFPEACGQSGSASSLLHGDRPGNRKIHAKKRDGK